MKREPASIVIVDDASDVRLLVKTRLRLSGRFRVVGEGSDGRDAVALAAQHRPSLMLLDVSMPAMDGLQALPEVLEASPTTRVVLFSGFEEQGLADKALELGAAAFLEKSTPIEDLIEHLATLHEEPRISTAAVPTSTRRPPTEPVPSGPTTTGRYVPPAPLRGMPTVDQSVLEEHLERFREVFEEAAIGMATMTLTGHLVRVNRAMASLMQRTPAELVGVFYGDLTAGHDDDVNRALDLITTEPVDTVRLEHLVTGADDNRQVLATLAPVRDSLRRPLYLFLQVQDVTAERAATEQLRRSEERFRLLVETVQDYAIFMLDPGGRIASWNAGAQRTKGYTADEIIGQHFRVFYPPEVAARRHPEHELELALRDGAYSEEGWRVRKDGTTFWASVVITAVFNDRGEHVGFAKVTRDITERRNAEERLRQSEERFRLLVETVQDYAIFMLDPDGRIASWNAGAQRTKGYTADEIIGQHFRVFYPPEVAARRHPEHELELAVRDGAYSEEGWRVRKDGTTFWANVVITAIFNREGKHLGFTKVTRDNTERRILQQRLQQAADDQAQFLAVTAHELRTPIGVLGGSADTLARHWTELTDEERSELLEAMTNSTGRLKRLLDDLLTASRLQASALEIQRAPVLVADIVADAVSTVRRTLPAGDVRLVVPPDLRVDADRDRLVQALENLLSNALRHGAPPVTVTATTAGDRVEVRVRDEGGGVRPEMRDRLFDRFATGRAKGGTGLGLFLVRELARAHDGDAFYEPPSADAAAGAFVLTIPMA